MHVIGVCAKGKLLMAVKDLCSHSVLHNRNIIMILVSASNQLGYLVASSIIVRCKEQLVAKLRFIKGSCTVLYCTVLFLFGSLLSQTFTKDILN